LPWPDNGPKRRRRIRIKVPSPVYCNLSEDIQQVCWRSLLMICRRYIQWYISYLISITIDWCLAPHRWGFYNTHSNAPQSVGLLWTSGQFVVETSTWQHTTLTTDRHPRQMTGEANQLIHSWI
jgi:hypothetical protein